MKPYIPIIFFLVFVFISFAAYSSQPRITKSQLSDRLEQPNITSIWRDKNGFLWVGTQQGLYRFDGSSITIFNSEKTNRNWIPASEITDITEDLEGNILVATFNGAMLRWNSTSHQFDSITKFNRKKQTHLTRILASKLGHIWLGTKNGLILYGSNPQLKTQQLFFQEDLEKIGRPHFLLEDETGNLLVGSNLGLFIVSLDDGAISKIELKSPELPNIFGVTALALDKAGSLYIGTNTGHLALLDLATRKILSQSTINTGQSGYISDILILEDKLLVATDNGLFFSNLDFTALEELSKTGTEPFNKNITNLYYDGHHIWIGTYQGLNILSFTPFDVFNEKNSAVSNDVISIEEDISGSIWVGTYSGLYLYSEELKSHIKYETYFSSNALIDERISSISRKGNNMWLGFYNGGVQVIDTSTGDAKTLNLPNIDQFLVTKILASKNTSNIWIATYDHGLFRVTPQEKFGYLLNRKLQEKSVTLLFETDVGDFLIATVDKIHIYSAVQDAFKTLPFDFKTGVVSPTILSFAQNQNGDIWIGTKDNGLFVWTKENQLKGTAVVRSMEKTNSRSLSTIYAIQIDDQGDLWCSTQNGLVKLDESGNFSRRFTTIDGLQGNDFELGSSYQDRNGYLYFGGSNGYNRFHPREIVIDASPSPMRLTGINFPRENGKTLIDVSDFTSIQLTHKDKFVTFEFSVLDFIDPQNNQYRYKLQGFDTDWIDNGIRNTATYTNLPSGDYLLRVQGSNSAGIWNREGLSIAVNVAPAPWLMWWAYCFYGLVILAAVWSALRISRSYAIDRKAIQLVKERHEAEERADDDMQEQLEIQDDIVKSAYQHNLGTLSLISDFVSSQASKDEDDGGAQHVPANMKRIAALAKLEDCLFYHAGGPAADLKKYTEIVLSQLLAAAPVNPETIVTVNEMPDTLVPAVLASPLAIVIYEILENCLQHAFVESSPANYIQISLTAERNEQGAGDLWTLIIRDSGIGMPTGISNLEGGSSGLAVVHKIITKLQGVVNISSDGGTTVQITLPYDVTSENPAR